MKRLIICLAAFAMLSTTVGCANGPIRSLLKKHQCNNGCEAPASDPSYGYGFDQSANGTISTPVVQNGNIQGQVQGDPYIYGSNYGSATINPPVFDGNSNPSYGSTIAPSNSNGMLPPPNGG